MGTLHAKSRDGPLSNRNLFSHKQLHGGRHDGHEPRCDWTCLISGGIQPLWGTPIGLIKKCDWTIREAATQAKELTAMHEDMAKAAQ